MCAGIAGVLAASNIKGADANHAGLFLELDAIVAVVVGGTALTGGRFYLLGSVIGAIIIQTLTTTMYAQNVSSDVVPVPKALGDFGSVPAAIAGVSPADSSIGQAIARSGAEVGVKLRSKYIPLLATIGVFAALYCFGCAHYDHFGSLRVAVELDRR